MAVKNNADLSAAIETAIQESGMKKNWIADKLEIANQNLNRLISKKNLSLDDANKILNLVGFEAEIIIKRLKKNL